MPQNASRSHLVRILLVAVVLSIPLLLWGAPDLSHDGGGHARWAKQFSTQFWQGDLYPRWMASANGGLGAPTFFFYPPLPSYVAALIWPISSHFDAFGFRTAGFAAFIGLFLSGVTAYYWLRAMTNAKAALFGATVYILMPYHVAIDLYNRGAMGEFWTFVWMPLILLAAHHLAHGRKRAFFLLAASYAALLFTHLLTALAFSAVPVALALYESSRGRRLRTLAAVGAAMTLGAGITSVFVLPALFDQHKSYLHLVLGEDYREWWLFQRNPPLNLKTRILAITLSTFALGLGLFWAVRRRLSGTAPRRRAFFYAAVACASFYFMTQFSAIFWALIPPLRFMQFPIRFNTVLCVATAALCALAFPALSNPRRPAAPIAVSLLLIGWTAADLWAASMAYTKWRAVPSNTAAFYHKRIQLEEEFLFYWTRSAGEHLSGDALKLEQFVATHPPRAAALLIPGEPTENAGSVAVASRRSRRITFDVNATADATLTLNHFHYPGWRAYIPNIGKDVPVRGAPPDGLLEVKVPRGSYRLVLTLERDLPERAGIALSCASLFVTAGAAAWAFHRRTPKLQPALAKARAAA